MSIVKLENIGIYFSKPTSAGKEIFWALKDINLNVEKGEVIGIIGPNGAGKTTLLSLIGGIFKADRGKIVVTGKTAPFLGLGVGFHPELTAEDNIILYGSILGIKSSVLKKRISEIMHFADLTGFEKMKVKHFSSGMYVRLGFAVSVMVEPDIFLIDEVLSVGDANFMKKSINKIKEFIDMGKTAFIVSHDLGLILKFAHRIIWMDKGRIIMDDEGEKVVSAYIKSLSDKKELFEGESLSSARWGSGEVLIEKIVLKNESGEPTLKYKYKEDMIIEIYYNAKEKIEKPIFGINIQTADGVVVLSPNSKDKLNIPYIEGKGKITVKIKSLQFNTGNYFLTAAIYDKTNFHPYDHRERVIRFYVDSEEKSKFTDSIIIADDYWNEG